MNIAKFGFSLFGINTYVVYDPVSKECAIIDPGMITDEERDAMVNFIKKNDLKPVHLINTHLHIDHCIGNGFIQEKYGLGTSAHSADEILGKRLKEQADMFGIPFNPKDIEITTHLKTGDVIRIGNGELKVIHVPGHSPGGIALYDEKDKFIISGDSLFQGSIGRTDLPGGDHAALLKAIRENLFTLPDDVRVYPGHGPETQIGYERRGNPFF